MQRGLFISFEGTEGSGKSTQVGLLAERLREAGRTVSLNQEPGGTAIGKDIRRILLDPANAELASKTELLLMFASRAQAAAEIILPALQRNETVLSDRFTDSSLAYQGAGRELGFETVWALHELALGLLLPDVTICISVDVEAGLARATRRNQNQGSLLREARIDEQSLEFHHRVAAAYERIAESEPHRFYLVNGDGTIESVAERIWQVVQAHLN